MRARRSASSWKSPASSRGPARRSPPPPPSRAPPSSRWWSPSASPPRQAARSWRPRARWRRRRGNFGSSRKRCSAWWPGAIPVRPSTARSRGRRGEAMPDGALHQEDDSRGLLIFELSGGGYALPVASVVEILPLIEPVAVSGWPEHGLGIFELRGEPVPLLDVRAALGRPARPPSPSQLVL